MEAIGNDPGLPEIIAKMRDIDVEEARARLRVVFAEEEPTAENDVPIYPIRFPNPDPPRAA